MKISCFTDLFDETFLTESPFLSHFIKGHLMLEFLMLKCVEITFPEKMNHVEKLTHFKLIIFLYDNKIIPLKLKDILISINRMRNKFAHNIAYEPSISEYEEILLEAKSFSQDMTDGILQTLEEVKDKKILGECESSIFVEPFLQLSYDLHSIYQENGGDWENFIKKDY